MTETAIPDAVGTTDTANDRFKRSFTDWFWSSMIVATVLHFGMFALWPDLTAEDVSFSSAELESIELPPEIEIPPPPKQISRPATPVVSTAQIDEDITIAPTTFEDNPVEDLPPPPEQEAGDLSAAPVFTPMTVRPEIKNRAEVIRAMEREYPPILRDAGIGGTVVVYFFVDTDGTVLRAQIHESSGHAALDEAAINVSHVYRLSPALNRDQKVQVWVQFPITFEVR